MIHNKGNTDFNFYKEPESFNKYTDINLLKYCLGATLYMPSKKDIVDKIINKEIEGLTTIAMCFEDAIRPEDLQEAENNVIEILERLSYEEKEGNLRIDEVPLYFIRVRNAKQFLEFTNRLQKKHLRYLTGFIFPKFHSKNAKKYLGILKDLNLKHNEMLYGMPILESKEIMYKEDRSKELTEIKNKISEYKKFILNIRVGGTDFSSLFGVRRGIDYTIYDIHVVRDCLIDIINVFGREEEDYVISAPVWEYFSNENKNRILKPQLRENIFNIHDILKVRSKIINEATDGLIREVILDKANGFVGKTIIHPSHLKYVNAIQCVTREEYEDATMIIENQGGGVLKGASGNKMNETNPHLNWAKKILYKAKAYGVIENNSYAKLF